MSIQTIKLKKEHTHDSVKHPEGSEISVHQADAEWLITNGIGDLVKTKKEAEASPDKDTKK